MVSIKNMESRYLPYCSHPKIGSTTFRRIRDTRAVQMQNNTYRYLTSTFLVTNRVSSCCCRWFPPSSKFTLLLANHVPSEGILVCFLQTFENHSRRWCTTSSPTTRLRLPSYYYYVSSRSFSSCENTILAQIRVEKSTQTWLLTDIFRHSHRPSPKLRTTTTLFLSNRFSLKPAELSKERREVLLFHSSLHLNYERAKL